jgi:hypothetical protein
MGTKFRTMLAPIGLSTGDGRRFATGGISLADVPFPFEWVRSREGGHDGAVSVGVVQQATVATVKEAVAAGLISADAVKGLDPGMEAVWGTGEMFDDADRETMPQLAEDVATTMHLIGAGTLGPSVDLDSFEGVPVMEGSDEPITWEDVEDHYEQTGEEPKIELLITQGRVRAGTRVSIPAFVETSRPLELVTDDITEAATVTQTAALIASVATIERPAVAAFTLPVLSGPTPITFDWDSGVVFGHIATWDVCHVGYADVCITAPRDLNGGSYAAFNRYPVETRDGGVIWAGRLTVGGHHASLALNASATMSAYDDKTVAAYVRAYEDEFGLVMAGVIEPGLTSTERATLNRRKVSGDWRETPDGLSLVEVLALSPGPRAHSEPGFPIPGVFSVRGRQTALTAALGPVADVPARPVAPMTAHIAEAVRQALADDRAAQSARNALAAQMSTETQEQRAALRAALQGS